MRTRQQISRLSISTTLLCVAIAVAGTGAWGCSSYKNYDERLAAADVQDTCNCIAQLWFPKRRQSNSPRTQR